MALTPLPIVRNGRKFSAPSYEFHNHNRHNPSLWQKSSSFSKMGLNSDWSPTFKYIDIKYPSYVVQMKRDFAVHEMARNVEAAKFDLLLGLRQREAFVHKLKLDNAASDLADFRVSFGYLSTKSCETNENDSGRNFIWNQYKNMESDLTQRLKSKSTEVEQANEKIQKLVASLEQLQSLNSENDRTILTLKTNMAELEASSVTKNEEISKLSRELKLLRDARSNSAAPVLRNGSAESRLEHKNRSTGATNITPKKKPRISGKGCESSKRKAVDGIPISEPLNCSHPQSRFLN